MLSVMTLSREPLLLEAIDKTKHLHVFDMDGTLMLSPEPKWGKDWYRYHSRDRLNPRGRNWDHEHEGWWSNPHSLRGHPDAPFPIRPIEHSVQGYHAAKQKPGSKVVIMTGRVNKPDMRHAVSGALEKIGISGHEHGKDLFLKPPTSQGKKTIKTAEWKKKMIHRFVQKHPHLKHVSMWDDRPDHADQFADKLDSLGMKHSVHRVQDPRWGSNMPDHT